MTRTLPGWVGSIVGIVTTGMLLFSLVPEADAELWERYLKGPHGPYRGRVIDAETKEPLVGAVVVAIWERVKVQLLHSSTVFYDARETLTDTNGEFTIHAGDIEKNAPHQTLRPFFIMFLRGYGSYPGYQVAPKGFLGGIFEGVGATVELPRLTRREERLKIVDGLPPGSVPDEKIPNLIRLMNEERVGLGLDPVHLYRGK